MSDDQLEILRLKGEILLLENQLDWFAAVHDLWRAKYLREHPELDSWEKVEEIENENMY